MLTTRTDREASQDADVLIESPQTMAGIHCAEALGIPYFRAFTMPWTRTSVAPHAFAPIVDLGPSYNLLSYYAFETTLWRASASQINRWRRKTLKLPRTNLHALSQGKVPFLYNFSSAVLPKPNDWPDYIAITGYWHLESASDWLAPEGLTTFMDKARKDGKPLVYIGFGSIVVPDAEAVTRAVVASVLAADVRAILVKGWSERGSAPQKEQVELPEEIYAMDSVPHDKLFPLIDAAVHHGGAGTTGASLRAGLPTLIHPFFGDQVRSSLSTCPTRALTTLVFAALLGSARDETRRRPTSGPLDREGSDSGSQARNERPRDEGKSGRRRRQDQGGERAGRGGAVLA